MQTVTDPEELARLYGAPNPRSLTKVMSRITPAYRAWIAASRFCILSTVGPEGTDASPRGDDGPVARIVDDRTLWLPDWKGNNRMDSLRNIVRDPRASLMFLVPGSGNVVRLNGRAAVTIDDAIRASFDRAGKQPRSVIVFTADEIYYQCAKAILRSGLWSGETPKVPSAGDFAQEADPDFDGKAYDAGYADYAKPLLW